MRWRHGRRRWLSARGFEQLRSTTAVKSRWRWGGLLNGASCTRISCSSCSSRRSACSPTPSVSSTRIPRPGPAQPGRSSRQHLGVDENRCHRRQGTDACRWRGKEAGRTDGRTLKLVSAGFAPAAAASVSVQTDYRQAPLMARHKSSAPDHRTGGGRRPCEWAPGSYTHASRSVAG